MYKVDNNKIIITNLKDFNIVQILDCGQIFRYGISGNKAIVYSQDKKAEIITEVDKVVIKTDDVEYFINFFCSII